jgi:hypothetical protein
MVNEKVTPSSLMSKALEEGLMVISAFLFWQRRLTMILIPFHLAPSLMMSSPTFFGFYELEWGRGYKTKRTELRGKC